MTQRGPNTVNTLGNCRYLAHLCSQMLLLGLKGGFTVKTQYLWMCENTANTQGNCKWTPSPVAPLQPFACFQQGLPQVLQIAIKTRIGHRILAHLCSQMLILGLKSKFDGRNTILSHGRHARTFWGWPGSALPYKNIENTTGEHTSHTSAAKCSV